jgi:hypothetical protein
MHTLLKQKTWQFYLRLKAVSTEQQASQLEKAFEPLFINENLQATPHGFHQGWRKVKN